MAGTAAPVNVTSSGTTPIDAVSMSNGTVTVERQVITLADPVTWANQAQVGNAVPGSTDFGLTVRTAGSNIMVGAGAVGVATVGNPAFMAGTDGSNTRALLTDTSGRQIVVGAAARGGVATGNPLLVAGIDGLGNAQALLTDTTGKQIVGVNLPQESQFPGFDIVDTSQTLNANVDKFGSLVTRGSVITDEGTFRANFSNSSLLVSVGTCTVSGLIVTGTFSDAQDVRIGDYFKFDADAETAFVQITTVTPTKIYLASSYVGAASGAASRSKFVTSTLAGTTQSVATGQYTLVSGVGGTIGQSRLFRNVDYLPLSFRSSYQLSARFSNQVAWLGLRENATTFTNHRFFAAFIFSGITAGSVTCITGFNATGSPTSSEKDSITINMPTGVAETSANEYRIDVISDVVNFYISGFLVASTSLHIPAPYSTLSAGFWLDIQGATSSATHKIDYISVKNHDVLEVNSFSPETRVTAKSPVATTINAGTIGGGFSYTYNIPEGVNTINVGIVGSFVAQLQFQVFYDYTSANAIPAVGVWIDAVGGSNGVNYTGIKNFNQTGGTSGSGSFSEFTIPPGAKRFYIQVSTFTSGLAAVYITPIQTPYRNPLAMMVSGLAPNSSAIATNNAFPIITGGSDGTNIRTTQLDTIGRTLVVGAGPSGSAKTGNPVLIAGQDGTNVQTLLTSTSGVLDVQLTGATGTALLPTAAATADALANPTTTQIQDLKMQFNGASWDRERNNANVVMGDTGAKTATFFGATQTNYNNAGAQIMVLVSAVSGTAPMLTAQLQTSPDGGTTWLNYGPASTALTAAGTILIDVYPTNNSVAGATPTALTTGATQTVQINGKLTRTWRLSYVISGTTPSYTFTNAYAAYTL